MVAIPGCGLTNDRRGRIRAQSRMARRHNARGITPVGITSSTGKKRCVRALSCNGVMPRLRRYAVRRYAAAIRALSPQILLEESHDNVVRIPRFRQLRLIDV